MHNGIKWRRLGVALLSASVATVGAAVPAQAGGGPVAVIDDPADIVFSGGESFTIAADPSSAGTLTWTVERLAGVSPVETIEAGGSSVSFAVPASIEDMPVESQVALEDSTTYLVTLTATVGATEVTDTLLLTPQLTSLSITSPTATEVQLDSETLSLPLNRPVVVGYERTLEAPAVTCIDGQRWVFARWSNGRTTTGIDVTPSAAPVALTMNYTNQGFAEACQATTNPPDVYRAINLNGQAIVVDGIVFETGRNATNLAAGPNKTCARRARPAGATVEQRELLKCFVWGGPNEAGGNTRVALSGAPVGVYDVYLWVYEDNFAQTYDLFLNNARVANNLRTGEQNSWERIGPYRTTVASDGRLIAAARGGDINFSAIELRRPSCQGQFVTLVVTAGQTLTGTAGDDVILGTEGDDVINSGGGNDVVCSLGGNDTVNTGSGADIVATGGGNDNVTSGGGADSVRSGTGDDRVKSGGGDDVVRAGGGNDNVKSGGGGDNVRGNGGDDRLAGGAGDDTLAGGKGADRVNGGEGTDACTGGPGANVITKCNP